MFESNCLDRASASENTRLGSTKALLFGHSVSFTPPTSVATQGMSHACASSVESGNPSCRDGKQNKSKLW